eukprot:477299-Hanusia_phi.AAC.1
MSTPRSATAAARPRARRPRGHRAARRGPMVHGYKLTDHLVPCIVPLPLASESAPRPHTVTVAPSDPESIRLRVAAAEAPAARRPTVGRATGAVQSRRVTVGQSRCESPAGRVPSSPAPLSPSERMDVETKMKPS